MHPENWVELNRNTVNGGARLTRISAHDKGRGVGDTNLNILAASNFLLLLYESTSLLVCRSQQCPVGNPYHLHCAQLWTHSTYVNFRENNM